MIREKSAGAIIFRRAGPPKNGEARFDSSESTRARKKIRYLLLHYESGHWDFPRGHIERGETEQETARREIREETGIKKINFIPEFRFAISWFYRKKVGKKTLMSNKTAVLFLAETKVHQVKISDEHIGYKWLDFNKAISELTFLKSQKILQKANEFLEEKTI
ncbi:MAG: NUDIX domain-containing protein [bacterium]|nr:NUDIX domain-containing protein [bacterium]